MTKTYDKLVRDRIPEIIEGTGQRCEIRVLSDEDCIRKLDEKLNEELAEYQESKAIEELADLLEVIEATARMRGCSWEALLDIKEQKRQKRGGFDKKLLLLEVSDQL